MINRLKKQAKLVFSHIEKSLGERGVSIRPAALGQLADFAPQEIKNRAVEMGEKLKDPFFFWSGMKIKDIKENSVLISFENQKAEAAGLIAAGERAVGLLLDQHLPPGQSSKVFQSIAFEAYDELKRSSSLIYAEWPQDEIELAVSQLIREGDAKAEFVVLVLDEKQMHSARIFYSARLKYTPLLT